MITFISWLVKFYNSSLLGPSVAFTCAIATIELQELISGGQEVEAGAFNLGLAGRKDNEDIGVGCESCEDEVKPRGFDDVLGELLGGC